MKKIDLKDERLFRHLVKILLAFYLVLLIWVVFFKCGMSGDVKTFYVNFSSKYSLAYRFYRCIIPFAKIVVDKCGVSILPAVDINDALNILVFIPFGFLVSYMTSENRKKTMLHALGMTVFLEAVQFVTLIGAFATKDIVTNLLGAFIGVLLFKAYKKIKFSKAHSICAIVMLFCAVTITAVAIYTVAEGFEDYLFILQRKAI